MVTQVFKPKEIRNMRLLYDKGEQRHLIGRGITQQGQSVLLSSLQGRTYLTDINGNTLYSSKNPNRVMGFANSLLTVWK